MKRIVFPFAEWLLRARRPLFGRSKCPRLLGREPSGAIGRTNPTIGKMQFVRRSLCSTSQTGSHVGRRSPLCEHVGGTLTEARLVWSCEFAKMGKAPLQGNLRDGQRPWRGVQQGCVNLVQ